MWWFVIFESRRFFSGKETIHVSVDFYKVRVQSTNLFLLSKKNVVHLLLVMVEMHQRFLHRQPLLPQLCQLIRYVAIG